MSENLLIAEERTEFGKGAARRVRRNHQVPAVLYGHGATPRHLSLPGHDLMLALKHGGANALLTLKMSDGEQLALPKAVTRDPIKGFLEHVDLVLVRRGEKVTVEVPLQLVGEHKRDVLITQQLTTLTIEAEATHIPTGFEFDISGLEAGTNITAGHISLPTGSTLIGDTDAIAISALAAQTAAQADAELAEASAEAGITPTVSAETAAAVAAEAAE